MIIDFTAMEKTVLHEFKGGNKDTAAQMHVDELLFFAVVPEQ